MKRIHEYKRQHLNALRLVVQYLRIKQGDTTGMVPRTIIFGGKALQEAFALIERGHFSGGERDLFRPLLDQLRGQDPFFVLADFDDYVRAQNRVDEVWLDRRRWTTMALLNTARSGYFSSDRSIRDNASSIWKVHPQATSMASGNA